MQPITPRRPCRRPFREKEGRLPRTPAQGWADAADKPEEATRPMQPMGLVVSIFQENCQKRHPTNHTIHRGGAAASPLLSFRPFHRGGGLLRPLPTDRPYNPKGGGSSCTTASPAGMTIPPTPDHMIPGFGFSPPQLCGRGAMQPITQRMRSRRPPRKEEGRPEPLARRGPLQPISMRSSWPMQVWPTSRC